MNSGALLAVFLVGAISLGAVVLLARSSRWLAKALPILVGLAAGTLLGEASIHLLPRAFSDPRTVTRQSLVFVAAIVLFFALEASWEKRPGGKFKPRASTVLAGNFLHNLIDGVLIGASFLASTPVGILSTIAIMLHEIPHEIGVFGVLVDAGLNVRLAVMANAASALLAILGTLAALVAGAHVQQFANATLPLIAGIFVYIACVDLLPEIQRQPVRRLKIVQVTAVFVAILIMAWLRD